LRGRLHVVRDGKAVASAVSSYLSPKAVVLESRISGSGLYAVALILKGELVIDYAHGRGRYVDGVEAERLFSAGQDYMIQVGDDLFFAAVEPGDREDADVVNHSCNPNCGVVDSLKFVAMRDIRAGEEITVDYAMTESSDYRLECRCGSRTCRGVITGEDWRSETLRARYGRYFSDYLRERMP